MIYETDGGRVELPRDETMEAFVARLRAVLDDEAAPVDALLALGWGLENPLLEKRNGRAWVTAASHKSPWYFVMADMLARKQAQQDEKRFTMSVADAAEALGYSEAAVKQAISSYRLAARKVGNRLWLDPRQIEAFERKPRGPQPTDERRELAAKPVIHARIGSDDGVSFRVRGARVEGTKSGEVREGVLDVTEERIHVATSDSEKHVRAWVIEPAFGKENEIAFRGFFLRGAFRILSVENNASRARALFAAARKVAREEVP